jgi:protein-tyrosine kinase
MSATIIDGTTPVIDNPQIDSRLVALLKPESFETDQYRILRHAADRACKKEGSRIIAITSAVAGDGKTLTAINLAATIARSPQSRALLIDADMRRPSISKVLGRHRSHRGRGLVEAILDETLSLEQVSWRIDPNINLSIVTPREAQADTYDLLSSGRFEAMLREARAKFDYVIVDTPPVVAAPDSRLIAEMIDGYLIVVSADKTPRPMLEETLTILGPAKVLGLVFNRESHKYSRYGKYYYAYKNRPRKS